MAGSDGPLGTVAGVQFVAVFQPPVAGLEFQVALPALKSRMNDEIKMKKMASLVFIALP